MPRAQPKPRVWARKPRPKAPPVPVDRGPNFAFLPIAESLPGWDYRQWVAVIEHPELRESFYRKLRHLQAAGCSWSMAVALASSELHGEGVGRGLVEPLPLAASTGRTAAFTGLAIITLRRLVRGHPDFPRPYKLTERGDLRWPLPEIVAWLEGKAGRPLTRG